MATSPPSPSAHAELPSDLFRAGSSSSHSPATSSSSAPPARSLPWRNRPWPRFPLLGLASVGTSSRSSQAQSRSSPRSGRHFSHGRAHHLLGQAGPLCSSMAVSSTSPSSSSNGQLDSLYSIPPLGTQLSTGACQCSPPPTQHSSSLFSVMGACNRKLHGQIPVFPIDASYSNLHPVNFPKAKTRRPLLCPYSSLYGYSHGVVPQPASCLRQAAIVPCSRARRQDSQVAACPCPSSKSMAGILTGSDASREPHCSLCIVVVVHRLEVPPSSCCFFASPP
ncbi:uncharacterized protein LOC100381509 [Zea mays]|uniref:Uncharacterized protein n=1 Tax=Zea mays TaxID=4577 RepID=C0HGI8_MAIZE|nr:uncharacterized protein LOC100381509 [Zea mays]ACN26141.1 unknown [Zea mays]|eukprot:NP_001167811.1 uncharacterized protein LOC100381509 [Zea mays]